VAKAQSGTRTRSGTAAAELSPAELADKPDDADFTDETSPPEDELTATASRTPGPPASSATPGARPGPRQQPRRSGGSSARHRPTGKKKRR
jgi:hypothetical protein